MATEQRHIAPRTWLVPFLLFVAALAELLSMILMTVYRYRAQSMEPVFMDLSETGNVLGLLIALAFIGLFVILTIRPGRGGPGRASAAVALSCAGLVLISAAPLVAIEDRNYVFAAYLVYKALAFSLLWSARVPNRRWWVIATRSLSMTFLLTLLAFVIVIGTVLLAPAGPAIIDQPQEVYDAGVILGAAVWSKNRPSPVFRQRIVKGFDLLRLGYVQNLVVTGGNAPHELPEAEVARRELLKLGADPTRIVIETSTSSTVQQVMFIRERLLKQGWERFLIVSDQFHLTRALEICDFNDLEAHGVSSESPLGPQNLAIYHVRESVALVLYWFFGI